jgi:hypothetical protein
MLAGVLDGLACVRQGAFGVALGLLGHHDTLSCADDAGIFGLGFVAGLLFISFWGNSRKGLKKSGGGEATVVKKGETTYEQTTARTVIAAVVRGGAGAADHALLIGGRDGAGAAAEEAFLLVAGWADLVGVPAGAMMAVVGDRLGVGAWGRGGLVGGDSVVLFAEETHLVVFLWLEGLGVCGIVL